MFEIFGIPSQALFGQLLLGLINGSFYALLSLGLAVIFGMLNIINFTHGAQYMMGAFAAYLILTFTGLGYWPSLIIAPIVVGVFGMIIERTMLQWLYKLDHLYGLLLTFGIALIIEGIARNKFGSAGLPYAMPDSLRGGPHPRFTFPPDSLTRCRTRCAAVRISASGSCRTIGPGSLSHRSRSASAPGSSSSARGLAPTCAPPRRIRLWCAPSASMCRA